MQALLTVALPVFAIILAGWVSGRIKLLGAASSDALNRFVFYIALPPLLFLAMARTDPAEIFNWSYLGLYASVMVLIFAGAALLIAVLKRRSLAECAVAGMTASFGNTGYMGIPLGITAFGESAALPVIITMVFNSAVLVGLTSAIVEASKRKDEGVLVALTHTSKALLRNPLVMSAVFGIGFSVAGIPLPAPVITFCEIVGGAAGPCALFAIGLFLVGKPVSDDLGEVSLLVILKLIAAPALCWLLLPLFPGLDPLWVQVVLIMCALPVGANVFVLALKYDTYVMPASAATLLSTIVSVATVSVVLAWMGL